MQMNFDDLNPVKVEMILNSKYGFHIFVTYLPTYLRLPSFIMMQELLLLYVPLCCLTRVCDNCIQYCYPYSSNHMFINI